MPNKEQKINVHRRGTGHRAQKGINYAYNSGITLIALIITIILLIILAGVTLNIALGENGILNKSKNAVDTYKEASIKEEIELTLTEYQMQIGTEYGSIYEFLVAKYGEYNVIDNEDGTYTVTIKGYDAIINSAGQLENMEPSVKISNITITTEDGVAAEDRSIEEGTPLQISFNANIIGGTVEVTPTIPYQTDGTEKEVEFTIVGTVDGTEYTKTITVSVEKKYKIPPAIGDYVTYNVTYTDVCGYTTVDNGDGTTTNKYTEFTADNGWRILDVGTKNADGTYTGTKLISTGIPAKLFYYFASQDTTWWGTVDEVNTEYELSLSEWSANYSGYFAAYGLRHNFGKIPFTQGTSNSNNKGNYTKVNGKESGNLLGNEFVINEIATEVHNLTLAEINEARGYTDLTSTTSTATKDGDTGLFCLGNLASENSSFDYTSSTDSHYWLALYPNSSSNLRVMWYNGNMGSGFSQKYGVRPVVTLKDNITLKTTGEDEHWTIE